jgi:hypothetical protein
VIKFELPNFVTEEAFPFYSNEASNVVKVRNELVLMNIFSVRDIASPSSIFQSVLPT